MLIFAFGMWPLILLLGIVVGSGLERSRQMDLDYDERRRRVIGKAEW
jgi:uncharacterized membrane protein